MNHYTIPPVVTPFISSFFAPHVPSDLLVFVYVFVPLELVIVVVLRPLLSFAAFLAVQASGGPSRLIQRITKQSSAGEGKAAQDRA